MRALSLAALLLCPGTAPLCARRRGHALVSVLVRMLIPACVLRALPVSPRQNLIISQRPRLQILSHIGLQHMNLGGGKGWRYKSACSETCILRTA